MMRKKTTDSTEVNDLENVKKLAITNGDVEDVFFNFKDGGFTNVVGKRKERYDIPSTDGADLVLCTKMKRVYNTQLLFGAIISTIVLQNNNFYNSC